MCIGVRHLGYRLHYAIGILGIGDSKVLTCWEKIIKSQTEGEEQPMHWEIMIQDQRAEASVTLAMVRRVKSDFRDMVS